MKFSEKQIKLLEIFFKAVANKRRIKILILIKEKPNLNVDEISGIVKINYQTGATHIQRLEKAGLIIKKYNRLSVEHEITKRGKMFVAYFGNLLNESLGKVN